MAVLEAIRIQRLQFEAGGEPPAEVRQTPCEIRAHVRGLAGGRASVLLVARFFEGEPKPPFRLEVAVEGRFQLETGETLDGLARGAGPASLYPYLRDEVAHLTLRGGLAPLLLPPLRLAPSAVHVREDVN
ncbi:MAG: protein-export chaperone SecB [Proteobacteria bacterium]|nr:protein-export chaperone SecB [Pseudomonadota bacterium]